MCNILGMRDPHVVTVSPDKSNVILGVSAYESLEITFKPVIEKLRSEMVNMGRTIIFCQKQETCTAILTVSSLSIT